MNNKYQQDIKESKQLIQTEMTNNSQAWISYSETLMEKLKLIMPESNSKDIQELTSVMSRLALDIGSLQVSIRDATEKAFLAKDRKEKKESEKLAETFKKMYAELQTKLIQETKRNNASALILQGITDMGVKFINTIKENAVPMSNQLECPNIFNQQLIFMMIDKLPKIKELFAVSRNKDH